MDLKIMDPERPGVLQIRIHLEEEEDWMILSSDGQDTEAATTAPVTLVSEDINQVLVVGVNKVSKILNNQIVVKDLKGAVKKLQIGTIIINNII